MNRKVLLVAAAAVSVVACDGLKEALTAHVDVAARAGSQELSVKRLADLMGNSQAPLQKEVAKTIADVWVNYQLLAMAASRGDSLTDPKTVDDAMWAITSNQKARKWYETVAKTFPPPNPADYEQRYNSGELLSARHILLPTPPTAVTDADRDSVRKQAEAIRAQATPANFAELARRHSQDPGSAPRGGDLGVFPPQAMVAEFSKGITSIQPGQISPVVQTQYGFHIIYRPTFAEVRDQFTQMMGERGGQVAESTYIANLEKAGKVQIKPNAAQVVKSVAADLDGHRDDKTVVATSTAGDLTASRVARWIEAYPPQQRVAQTLRNSPDSVIPMFVTQLVRNELVLKQADSAKVGLDTTETNEMRRQFSSAVQAAWAQLGIAPSQLADSGKTPAERERVAAGRIDAYLGRLLQQQAQFVDVPQPIIRALKTKYEAKVNDAGLDRAVEAAGKVRVASDSVRNAQRPPTSVPMPGAGGPPGGPPGGMAPPPGAQPQPTPSVPPPPPTKQP